MNDKTEIDLLLGNLGKGEAINIKYKNQVLDVCNACKTKLDSVNKIKNELKNSSDTK